jgi:hypothetical protein
MVEMSAAWVAPSSVAPTAPTTLDAASIGLSGSGPTVGSATPPTRTGTRPLPLRPLSVLELMDAAVGAVRSVPRILIIQAFSLVAGVGLAGVGMQWAFDAAISSAVAAHPMASLDVYGNPYLSSGTYSGSAGFSTFAVDALIPIVLSGFATTLLAGVFAPCVKSYVDGERYIDDERFAEGEIGDDPQRRPDASWGRSWGRLPVLIRIGLVTLLPRLLLVALLALVAATSANNPQSNFAGLDTLFLVAGVPLCCWATAEWAVAAPVAVLERTTARAALSRAARLVSHGRWRTWWATTLTLFIGMCATVVLVGIGYGIDGGHRLGAIQLGSSGVAYRNLVGYLVILILPLVLTVPFRATTATMQYVDRRFRREGLDIRIAWARVAKTGAGRLDADRKAR